MKTTLTVTNLCYSPDLPTGKFTILENCNFQIHCDHTRGSINVIVGESGAGKTTLLRILFGEINKTSGDIRWETDGFPREELTKAFLSQDPVFFQHLNVIGNIEFFRTLTATKDRFDAAFFNNIIEILGLKVLLEKKGEQPIESLSGGEKQRVALARALSIKPRVLFLDEPCNGLGPRVKQSFLSQLIDLSKQFGLIVFYVSHHRDEISLLSDNVLLLEGSPSNNIPSTTHYVTWEHLVQTPSLVSSIYFLHNTFINVIRCVVKGRKTLLPDEKTVIAKITNAEDGEYYLLIPATNVTITADSRLKGLVKYNHGSYSKIEMISGDLIYALNEKRATGEINFSFNGRAYLSKNLKKIRTTISI